MTSAPSRGGSGAAGPETLHGSTGERAASPPALASATPRTARTRCGRRTSVWPLAAAASAAIIPATPSALERACPWPQPSATTSTTGRPRHFSQSSSLPRWPSAPAAQPATAPAFRPPKPIRLNGAPKLPPAGPASNRPKTTPPASGRTPGTPTSSGVSTERPNSRSCWPQSARGRAQPPFQPKRCAAGLDRGRPGTAGKTPVGAEHPVEKARRIRTHQLAAQAAALRHAGDHRRPLGRQPAGTDLPVGQEGAGHHRLDRRRRHGVVVRGRVEQRVGAEADRVGKAAVAVARPPGAVELLPGAGRQRPGESLDAAAGDVDDRHRRHPHQRRLEHAAADRPAAVFFAPDAERGAGVLTAGVAGRRLLAQRLQCGIDRQVDRKADVERMTVERDPVRPRRAPSAAVARAASASTSV